jgi:3-oxoadipate enol-lactonase
MDTRHGFAEVNDTRLYYEVAGTGEPLVLIHGFTLDTRMWDDQFRPLAEHHRVVRYDVRGFGKSAVPAGAPYTNADDLAALLDYLTIPAAAIIGLSMGGGIAIDFALAYPAMTRTLIPVDSSLSGHQWSGEWNARFGQIGQTARAVGVDAAKAEWLADPLVAPANERAAVAARLQRMVADYSGWHWINRGLEHRHDPPASARLSEITAPTLVVIGERDLPDFHVIADRMSAQAPNARKIVIPGVGHMANMEAPGEFNAAVLGFLSGI